MYRNNHSHLKSPLYVSFIIIIIIIIIIIMKDKICQIGREM